MHHVAGPWHSTIDSIGTIVWLAELLITAAS